MSLIKITVALGLVLIVGGVGLTLSQAPVTVAGANTPDEQPLGVIDRPTEVCQSNEELPRGTTAVRLRVFAYTGPRVSVKVLANRTVVARGERESGWTGGVVTIPIGPISTARPATLCFTISAQDGESDHLVGAQTARARATLGTGASLPGRVGVEYLRAGSSSWWSKASDVAKRMGFGNAGSGMWNAALALALMGVVGFLTSRLILRELR